MSNYYTLCNMLGEYEKETYYMGYLEIWVKVRAEFIKYRFAICTRPFFTKFGMDFCQGHRYNLILSRSDHYNI